MTASRPVLHLRYAPPLATALSAATGRPVVNREVRAITTPRDVVRESLKAAVRRFNAS